MGDSGRLRSSEPRLAVAVPEAGVERSGVQAWGPGRGGENAPARRPYGRFWSVKGPGTFLFIAKGPPPKTKNCIAWGSCAHVTEAAPGFSPTLLETTCWWEYGGLPKTPGRLRGFQFGP